MRGLPLFSALSDQKQPDVLQLRTPKQIANIKIRIMVNGNHNINKVFEIELEVNVMLKCLNLNLKLSAFETAIASI